MKPTCSFKGCRTKRTPGSSIIFYKFPTSHQKSSQWLENMGRENYIPLRTPYVCSKHFAPECFDRENLESKSLTPTAVPTIFDFTNNEDLSKDSKTEMSLNKGKKKKQHFYIPPLHLGLKKADKVVARQSKLIKVFKAKNRRLRQRVEKLNDILEEYKKRVYIPPEILKAALANNGILSMPTMDIASPTVNESCANLVPIEGAMAINDTIAMPTMSMSSPTVNESCVNSVPIEEAMVNETFAMPTMSMLSPTVNESCVNSVPVEEAMATNEIIAMPTMSMFSPTANESCANSVPIEKAMATNETIAMPTMSMSSPTVNESCVNSLPMEKALTSNETIAMPTMIVSSPTVNESCDSLVPNSF